MAGSLKRVPESKDDGYCCFIVVKPAEGMISAGFHRCTPCGAASSPVCGASQQPHVIRTRGGRTWQARCTDRKTN